MRRLGDNVDLEILHLAIKEKRSSFNENHLENSELKRLGVGRILDSLASLKDRKMLSLNGDGSFSITKLAQDILWSNDIPVLGKNSTSSPDKILQHLRKLQDILRMPEEETDRDRRRRLEKKSIHFDVSSKTRGTVGQNLRNTP